MRLLRYRIVVLAATLALSALVAGCGGSGGSRAVPADPSASAFGSQLSAPVSGPPTDGAVAEATAGGGSGGATAAGSVVRIVHSRFQPDRLEVAVGTTVTWSNRDDKRHRVKWQDGAPGSSSLTEGEKYRRTLDEPGTFPYICGIHPQMKATVIVGGR